MQQLHSKSGGRHVSSLDSAAKSVTSDTKSVTSDAKSVSTWIEVCLEVCREVSRFAHIVNLSY